MVCFQFSSKYPLRSEGIGETGHGGHQKGSGFLEGKGKETEKEVVTEDLRTQRK